MFNSQRLLFWQRYFNTATVAVTSDTDNAYTAGDQCAERPAGDLGDPGSSNFGSCGVPDEDGKGKDKHNRSWLFSMEMNAQVRGGSSEAYACLAQISTLRGRRMRRVVVLTFARYLQRGGRGMHAVS